MALSMTLLLHLIFAGRYLYTVYIMSDSYIGFDQQYNIQIEVIEGKSPADVATDDFYPKLK